MSAAVGSANVTQGTKVQLLSTTSPANAIGAIIHGQSGSYPQDTETVIVAASFTAYLDYSTNTLTTTYGAFADVNYEFGAPQVVLDIGGNGDLLPSELAHRIRIENYGGAGGLLAIYSEDLSLIVGNAAVNVMVEFITS